MSAEGELIDGSTLPPQVEDPDLNLASVMRREYEPSGEDLGIRDTPVVSRLGIWLVLAITVAAGWTTSHIDSCRMTQVSESAHPTPESLIHRFRAELRLES